MFRRLLLVVTLLLLFSSPAVFSHQGNVFCYRSGEQIKGEVYFGDGAPCRNCSGRVEAVDQRLFEFTTDQQGKFEFRVPKHEKFTVKIQAGKAHLIRQEVRLDTLAPSPGSVSSSEAKARTSQQRLSRRIVELRQEIFRLKIGVGVSLILCLTLVVWLYLRENSDGREN